MQSIIPGHANTIYHDLVRKDGTGPIQAGSVQFYLIALDGPHAGQWFKGADGTWSATEEAAGTGTFKAGATWLCAVPAVAWSYGVRYVKYAQESGALQMDYSEQIVASLALGAIGTGSTAWTYTLTETGGTPIADATVWVTTDADGHNVVYRGTTDALGVVTFYLSAGTYYIWRQKAGYTFTNPDTEVIS